MYNPVQTALGFSTLSLHLGSTRCASICIELCGFFQLHPPKFHRILEINVLNVISPESRFPQRAFVYEKYIRLLKGVF